jgi:hypothetical protein
LTKASASFVAEVADHGLDLVELLSDRWIGDRMALVRAVAAQIAERCTG